MKKYALIALVFVLGMGVFQPANAQNGFLGGSLFTVTGGTMPAIRFGAAETFIFDFGIQFSTVDVTNWGVAFRLANRFAEIDDVQIHMGGSFSIVEFNNDEVFWFGALIGAEAFINDAFSITADAIPLQIQANGSTEVNFLRGSIGVTLYIL
jgi:hypothetical protein